MAHNNSTSISAIAQAMMIWPIANSAVNGIEFSISNPLEFPGDVAHRENSQSYMYEYINSFGDQVETQFSVSTYNMTMPVEQNQSEFAMKYHFGKMSKSIFTVNQLICKIFDSHMRRKAI